MIGDDSAAKSETTARSTVTDGKAARLLLLAADDLIFPSRIGEALRPLGYSLRVAGTAGAVQEAARNLSPLAILVNLNARRFDAISLIRDLKADPATGALPILAFAGHVEASKHDSARRAGADMSVANSSVSLHLPRLLDRLFDCAPLADVPETDA